MKLNNKTHWNRDEVETLCRNAWRDAASDTNKALHPELEDAFINNNLINLNLNNDLYCNMQYYYEYCIKNGYITPEDWIKNHKYYEDDIEPGSYSKKEVLELVFKAYNQRTIDSKIKSTNELIKWFNDNKKKHE